MKFIVTMASIDMGQDNRDDDNGNLEQNATEVCKV